MFGFYTSNQYNVQMVTIQKSTVLDQNNATLTYHQLDRPLPNSTVVPATMHGSAAGAPMWLVEEKGLEQNGSYLYLRVEKMTNVLSATPTITDYYYAVSRGHDGADQHGFGHADLECGLAEQPNGGLAKRGDRQRQECSCALV
jgi:hypothetical protein